MIRYLALTLLLSVCGLSSLSSSAPQTQNCNGLECAAMAAVVPDVSQSSLTVVTVGLPSPPGKTQLTQQIVEGQPITVCTACKDCSKFIAVMDDGGTTNCDGYVEDDEFSPPYKYPLIPHGGTVEYRQNNKCKTDQNSATTLTVYRKCGSGPAEVAFLIRFWCEGGCP